MLPPQPLTASQPLGGASQPPPPINPNSYQVMGKQPHSARLPGDSFLPPAFGSVSDSGVYVPYLKRFTQHCLPLICLLTEYAPNDSCSGGCTDGGGCSQQPEESLPRNGQSRSSLLWSANHPISPWGEAQSAQHINSHHSNTAHDATATSCSQSPSPTPRTACTQSADTGAASAANHGQSTHSAFSTTQHGKSIMCFLAKS